MRRSHVTGKVLERGDLPVVAPYSGALMMRFIRLFGNTRSELAGTDSCLGFLEGYATRRSPLRVFFPSFFRICNVLFWLGHDARGIQDNLPRIFLFIFAPPFSSLPFFESASFQSDSRFPKGGCEDIFYAFFFSPYFFFFGFFVLKESVYEFE